MSNITYLLLRFIPLGCYNNDFGCRIFTLGIQNIILDTELVKIHLFSPHVLPIEYLYIIFMLHALL